MVETEHAGLTGRRQCGSDGLRLVGSDERRDRRVLIPTATSTTHRPRPRAFMARRLSGAAARRMSWWRRSAVAERSAAASPAASAATSSAVRPTLKVASASDDRGRAACPATPRSMSARSAPTRRSPARGRAAPEPHSLRRPRRPLRKATPRRCLRVLRARPHERASRRRAPPTSAPSFFCANAASTPATRAAPEKPRPRPIGIWDRTEIGPSPPADVKATREG